MVITVPMGALILSINTSPTDYYSGSQSLSTERTAPIRPIEKKMVL
jgi:hypothetical protein